MELTLASIPKEKASRQLKGVWFSTLFTKWNSVDWCWWQMDAANVPLVKGRELNYKCQSCILTVTTSGYFLALFLMGGGDSFKLNKQEFRCMEESTSVSDFSFWVLLVFNFWGGWYFLKSTELNNMYFIFNPENIYREDRKFLSTWCSLEYRIFVMLPVKFSRLECSCVTKTKTQRFFLSLYTNHCYFFFTPPPPLVHVPSFFSLFEKVGTDSSWQVYQSHCVMCAIDVALGLVPTRWKKL